MMGPSASLAFVGGTVITADERDTVTGGVWMERGLIRAVGPSEVVTRVVPPDALTIDISGKTLVPGFIDAHNHLAFQGAALVQLQCGFPRVASIDALVRAVEDAARRTPEGQWIRGWGMDYAKYPEGRLPTRWDIDAVSRKHPVCIVHRGGHFALVNTVALEQAGIGPSPPDPKGGTFVRDARGRPTGMLRDAARQVVIKSGVDVGNHGPDIGYEAPLQEIVDDIERAGVVYREAGLTSVVDPQVTGRELRAYLEARRQGKLKVKTVCMMLSNHLADMKTLGLAGPLGDAWLSIGPMKLYCDGSLNGTAALYSAWRNQPGYFGYTYWTEEELKAILLEAHRFGLQVGVHASGDRAIDMVLAGLEDALRQCPRPDHRHRIEHCHPPTPGQLERIARVGIIPVCQPRQLVEAGDNYIANLGEERARRLIPLRSELDLGIPVVVSTDAFVCSYRPLDNISAAMTRRTWQGQVLGAGERISAREAVRAYTISAARSVFQERQKGSIEVGKAADLVLIGGDLLHTPGEDVPGLPIEMTVIDGEVVYQAPRVA
jgi:predicted amidohydrolase YtcJ